MLCVGSGIVFIFILFFFLLFVTLLLPDTVCRARTNQIFSFYFNLGKGNTVAAMGPFKGLKQVRRIVEDCIQNKMHPVYHVKVTIAVLWCSECKRYCDLLTTRCCLLHNVDSPNETRTCKKSSSCK